MNRFKVQMLVKSSLYLLMMLALFTIPHCATAQVPFAISAFLTNGDFVTSATTADVNGDGYPDLISAYYSATGSSYVCVWTNNRSGLFVSNASYTVGAFPHQVITADVNNDGWPDLITANINSGSLTVLTNDGHGNFALSATLLDPSSPQGLISVAAADLFGRGRMDLIGANLSSGFFTIWTNTGGGMFGRYGALVALSNGPRYVTTADINGDGKPDIIGVANHVNTTPYLDIWTNNGAGGFAAAAAPTLPNGEVFKFVAADVNGDGKPDLIFAYANNRSIVVLTNDGTGAFALYGSYPVGNEPLAVIAADVNGDGAVDLISANRDDTLTVLTNNGGGIFSSNATLNLNSGSLSNPPVSSFSEPLTATDINGDGMIGLIGGNFNPGTLTVFTNAVTNLPSLKLTQSGTNFIVSWPAIWANWTLQQNTDLSQGSWASFSGIVGNDGVTKSLTNSSSTGNLFFRLMQ
jgi:hypothetical protein